MPGDKFEFNTQRKMIADEWAKKQRPYLVNFRPYFSTLQLVGTIVNAIPAAPNQTMAHVVFRGGQQLDFFSYGRGDQIDYGPPGSQKKATQGDTNLLVGEQTHNEDFVIEALSITSPGKRVAYDGVTPAFDLIGTTDPDVLGAYEGDVSMVDPAALIQPPQVNSPYNLEDAILEVVLPHMSTEIRFDDRRTEDLGNLDQMPEGGGKSFLKAHGDPRVDNRARYPEGYVWRKNGNPDQNVIVRVRLEDSVMIPISLVALTASSSTALAVPTNILLDLRMRVHGVGFAEVSGN